MRLQLAHLLCVKTLHQFDFDFQPSIDERQIRELRTLRLAHEASNVILPGSPGVGKTHLAVSLAEAAAQSRQAAYFMTAHDLIVSARYDHGSVILTSNNSYGEWGSIFGDPRPPPAPFDNREHPGRKLPAQGAPQSGTDSVAGTATGPSSDWRHEWT